MVNIAGPALMAAKRQRKLDASRRTVSSPEFRIPNIYNSTKNTNSISDTNINTISASLSSVYKTYQSSFKSQLFTSLSSTDLWNSINRTSEYLTNVNVF
ncbi:unnamed protein product, partial [Meganyctiphanes norvegica]